MQIEENLKKYISEAFSELFNYNLPVKDIKIEPTRKDFTGSHTFVIFPYLKIIKSKPEEAAGAIGNYLKEKTSFIQSFNVVKGFLNLIIKEEIWLENFREIIRIMQNQELPYGFAPSNHKNVVIEYSSPNTNKPLHLGHLRNNFLGFSLAKILEANGFIVNKVNLINDRGIHICKSMLAYKKFGQGETPASAGIKGDHLVGSYYVKFEEAFREEVNILIEKGYEEESAKKNAPLILEAQEMLHQWEKGEPEVVELWKTMNQWVLEGFQSSYKKMGVSFDNFYYESDTYLLGKDIIREGLEKNIFYKKDNGSVWTDLSSEGLDEKLVLRADGTSVYITQDLGTADLKFKDYSFDRSVYVVGNEQDYHFQVLFAILKKLGRSYSEGLFHLSYGMVDLPSGKMKSREGTVVDADDLIEEMEQTAKVQTETLGKIEGFTQEQARELYLILGLGALKYFLLKVEPRKRMLFNPEESVQFQGNTAPFIQYTHARIAAILRKAEVPEAININLKNFAGVNSLAPAEQEVIQLLNEFPVKVAEAGEEYAPSLIAQYVYDLAKAYNRFYTEITIFGEKDPEIQYFRIAFSAVVAQVIKTGMGLLGIQVPERM